MIGADDRFDILDITFTEWTEFIPRLRLKENAIDSPEIKTSPNPSKSASKRAQQQQQQQQRQQALAGKYPQTAPIPETVVNEFGITKCVQQYLEFVDTMAQLTDVFKFAQARGGSLPAKTALQSCVSEAQPQQQNQLAFQQNQQAHMNPGAGMPPQMAGGAPPNFLSPAQVNQQNLPGAHMASPAAMSNHNTPAMPHMSLQNPGQPMPGQMGAPGMAHQPSHPGANASAVGTPSAAMTSANASPNVGAGAKRRRPSAVDDGDINGASVNGVGNSSGGGNSTKVKGTPKLSKKARPNG